MVCRAFGTVTHGDDYCPRERNEHGHIDYYSGAPIEEAIKSFQSMMQKYAASKDAGDNYDMVIYMPLGVLSFLLPDEQLGELYQKTDPKFWMSAEGWFNYRVHFTKLYGYDKEILSQAAKDAGHDIVFDDVEDGTLVEIERSERLERLARLERISLISLFSIGIREIREILSNLCILSNRG